MKNLADLLRNLLYHTFGRGRQGGLISFVALSLIGVGVVMPDKAAVVFDLAEHAVRAIATLIGSAIVYKALLHHGNELLRLLVGETDGVSDEAAKTVTLLKKFLGFSRGGARNEPQDDPKTTDSKSHDG